MKEQVATGRKPEVRITRKPFSQKAALMHGNHCSSANGCQSSSNASSR